MACRFHAKNVLFWTIVISLCFYFDCRPFDGYEFPVYTTESCPRNLTEWQERSSILNCTKRNTYMCVPDENITELLEFCYSLPQIQLMNGSCMILYKQHSAINAYDCSHFTEGCPSSNYLSQDVRKYQSCVNISTGCFLAEPMCGRPRITHQAATKNGNKNNWLGMLSIPAIVIIAIFSGYQYHTKSRRRRTLRCLEEEIPLMKKGRKGNEIPWNQPISSPTLEPLLNSITDIMPLLTSNSSFAYELLTVARMNELINEIKKLSKEVELYREIDTENAIYQPGKVHVFEVNVRCRGNELCVIKKDPDNWDKFLEADSKDLIKVINIQSRSLRVIDAKLRVYKEFTEVIDDGNIFLQHVLEDYDEIAKRSVHNKITSFCDITLHLKELLEKLLGCIPTILSKVLMQVLTQENILSMSYNMSLIYDGKKIGTTNNLPYVFNQNEAKEIQECFEENIISKISHSLSVSICNEIHNYLKSHIQSDKKKLNSEIFDELPHFHHLVKCAVALSFSTLKSSKKQLPDDSSGSVSSTDEFSKEIAPPTLTSIPNLTSPSRYLSDGATYDVNSTTWREYAGNTIVRKIEKQKKHIISNTEVKIEELCRITIEELQITYDRLRQFQDGIQLVHQKTLVETWQKREVIEDKKTFAKHPSISNCIAGIKYGKPFVKVFLMHGDEHGEFYDSNQSLNLEDTQFEYVNVSAQSKKKEEEFEILKGKEKEAPVLPNDIRNKLSEIINRQAEKIYAKHTTVTGIGVSNVRYEGDTLISDPCIVIYCLDALLLPYGETPLPTNIEGYPCDIREGIFMFGHCFDCRNNNPGPGCSIGMPDDMSTGSVGFFVESKKHKKVVGFITAAHVAIVSEELHDLHEDGLYLSKSDYSERKHEIIHPSRLYTEQNIVIGEVKESFIGNEEDDFGIDVAFVQYYKERLGETNVLQLADDKNLTFDGKTFVTKKGQRTAITHGLLKNNNFSIKIPQSRFPRRNFIFNNCYEIRDEGPGCPFFRGGDSGSGVFVIEKGQPSKPLGIAFAFQPNGEITVVCKVNSILDKCKLAICQEEIEMDL